MKNIVIINQPLKNRGDEAAHRSLLRALDKNLPQSKITVLFQNAIDADIEEFIVQSPRITYTNIKGLKKAIGFSRYWALKLNKMCISLLHPTNRKYAKIIKKADLIICAPGGICMGLFQDWNHIYALSLAKYYKKKIVYYSRSFGPFPVETKKNRLFKKISVQLLNRFSFLSIRDVKTMQLADEMKLTYISSIDTAFLDNPDAKIPEEIVKEIDDEKYIVFVPNSLTWHKAYKNIKQEEIDNFYIDIINLLLKTDKKVVFLPQKYNRRSSSFSDYQYFLKLKGKIINNNKLLVIAETYSSDIQQKIIANADCVIGARYHSIIFAINNYTPFISLSYEHKMTGLLNILNLNDREVNIETIGTKDFNKEKSLSSFQKILNSNYSEMEETKSQARQIATETFEKFVAFCDKGDL